MESVNVPVSDQSPAESTGDLIAEPIPSSPALPNAPEGDNGDACVSKESEETALLFATAAETQPHEEELNAESKGQDDAKEMLATTQSVAEENLTEASPFESGWVPMSQISDIKPELSDKASVQNITSQHAPVLDTAKASGSDETLGASKADQTAADGQAKAVTEEQSATNDDDDETEVKRKRRPLPDVTNKEELNAWLASISSDLAKVSTNDKDEENDKQGGEPDDATEVPTPKDAQETHSVEADDHGHDGGEAQQKRKPECGKSCQDSDNPMADICNTVRSIQSQMVIVSSQFINLQYKIKDVQKAVDDLAKNVEKTMEQQKQDIATFDELD